MTITAADLMPQPLVLERMLRLGLPAEAEIPLRVIVEMIREPRRARCAVCRIRRVVYRVRVAAVGMTEARCAPCWGIRE